VGDLTLDPTTHEVRVRDRVVLLTATEYRLLEELVRHAGRPLPHAYLLTQVWGPEYAGDLPTLRVFVQRLRAKLGDDEEADRYIHTERNIGYRFAPPHS
jgi:two-component system KDP operon response regulator KdpE